nr:MAG TPA: hypothetical protein [Caudoviricetes sp.]
MVVYNLYLVLNDELVQIYDRNTRSVEYEGSSNAIPIKFMNRLVHYLTIAHTQGNKSYQVIVLD